MVVMTVSEARGVLPEILDRIAAGEEVTLTRHGQPVAVIVRPDTLRVRRSGDAPAISVCDALETGRNASLLAPTLSRVSADALAAEVRQSRSRE